MNKTTSLFLVLLFMAMAAKSQEAPKYFLIKTHKNQKIAGEVVERDSISVHLRDANGTLHRIYGWDIKKQQPINFYKKQKGEIWQSNHQFMHNTLSTNAFTNNKGQAYIKSFVGYFNQVNIGLHQNFSMGATILPFFSVNPQFTLPVIPDELYFGVSSHIGVLPNHGNEAFVEPQMTITIGSHEGYGTLSIGNLISKERNRIVVTAGFSARITQKSYLSGDYVYVNNMFQIGTLGMRNQWPNVSLDYGLMLVLPTEEFHMLIPLPYIGIGIPINHVEKYESEFY